MAPESRRKRFNTLWSQMKTERSSFDSHWRDLSDFILPRRAQFSLTDMNRGEKKNQNIIDGTATFSLRTLKSGLVSGITSPARPWFDLTIPDKDMVEFGPIKTWLADCTKQMSNGYRKTNYYQVAPIIYGDLGCFGTGAMFVDEDFDNIARFYPMPIGSYCIANDAKLRVRVFVREMMMTVRQVVEKFAYTEMTNEFDWTRVSEYVKRQWDNGNYETSIQVRHVVQPNTKYNPKKLESKYKRYESVYYEPGGAGVSGDSYISSNDEDKFLSEKGYDYFPVLAPRWEITGFDVYGTDCPGMTALGDIKALQKMQRRKAEAIEKMVRPPMVGSASLKRSGSSMLPGEITYTDNRKGEEIFRPAYQVDPRIQEMMQDINDHQKRIQKAFYEDIFLMMAMSDRREITATEIAERREEKLVALGSVYDRINEDQLDPQTDIMFQLMWKQGRLPAPPPELEGIEEIGVEYTSVMAQAQKLLGLSAVERFSGFCVNLSAQMGDPTVMDKVDTDQMIDVYGDRVGVDPSLVRSDDAVYEMRAARQQQAQQAQQADAIAKGAKAAKDLAGADMEGDNALTRLMQTAQAGG
jgi:hypothetical protein